MGKYIVKRILQFIPVFIGVTIILFAIKNIVPGDPIKLITGEKAVTPEIELQLRIANHLVEADENGQAILDADGNPVATPLWKQYGYYVGGLLHGDLGDSYSRKMPVTQILADKYPYTIRLALVALCIEIVVGIGAGMISAIKRYSFWDVLVTLCTSVLVAMPAFWLVPAHLRRRRTELGLPDVHALHPARHHAGERLHGLCRPHHALAAA